jgi:hypothetical protein
MLIVLAAFALALVVVVMIVRPLVDRTSRDDADVGPDGDVAPSDEVADGDDLEVLIARRREAMAARLCPACSAPRAPTDETCTACGAELSPAGPGR